MAETRTYQGRTYTRNGPGDQWVATGPATQGPQPQGVTISQGNPYAQPQAAASLANTQTNIADTATDNAREAENNNFKHVTGLATDYNSDPSVKAYRVAISQFGQALNTGAGPQGDLALTYAFAKAMDPDSVVREAEQGMVSDSQPWLQAAVEKTKKQFGMDGAGNYTPETRDALRQQISSSVAQRAKIYDARRHYYEAQANALGLDPKLIIGEHDAKPFVPAIQDWVKRVNGRQEQGLSNEGAGDAPDGQELLGYSKDGAPIFGWRNKDGKNPLDGDSNYIQSPLQQGVYGTNEGIASTLGLPVDLMTAGMNLVPKGINALANTNIPEIDNPVGGSDWMQGKFKDIGFVGPDAQTTGGQVARRAGQSIGATAASLPFGGAASFGRIATPLASAAGGGLAAGAAQQAFPGNPLAEFAAEMAGSGLTGYGLLKGGQHQAQRVLDDAIPTVGDLRDQARGLYRQAESNGVTASPQQTQQLHQDFSDLLRREGQLGPQGAITNADTSSSKAFNLLGQYAGQPMRPTEMDTVRRVIADGRKSTDPSDQRIAGLMLDQFDDFARPLAPEFDQARSVAGRYLQAEDLEQARELAGARAGQFTGSGFENALRTEYRGLDRNNIKGRNNFAPPVVEAIQNVSRGTPASNVARNIGRFAPTGPVSGAASFGVPFAVGTALGGPALGTTLGATASGIGMFGRQAATRMGTRNAEIAELTARNGAPINIAALLTPEMRKALGLQATAQLGLYQEGQPTAENDQGPNAQPYPLSGAVGRGGLFGRPR